MFAGLFIHALSSCFSNLVSHLEIASSSSLAMSKKRRRVSTAPASATPPKDALLFLGKTFDDQNGVQDLAAILAHALHVAASHWSHPGGSNSLHTKTAAHPGVRESNVSELLSVLTSLLGKLLGQGDVLLVLQPLLSPLAQWLALTHSWKPALNFGSQPPESQPTQDVSPLLASLTTLWSQLLTALEKCHPPLEFDSQTLQTLSPLLEHSLAHSHQPIANRAVSFWESTFAKSGGNGVNGTLTNGTRGLTGPSHAKVSQGRSQTQGLAGELIYPAELVPILTRIRGKVDLPLPDWNGPDLPALEDGVKRPRDEEPALEHSKLGTEKLSERSLGNRAKLGLDDNEEGAKSGGVECKRSLVVGVLQSAVLGLELDICDGIVAGEGLKAADKGAEGSDGKLPSGKPGDGLDSTRMPPVGTRTLSGTEGRNDKGAEVVGAEAPPVASSKRRTSDGVKEEGSARLSVATTGSRGVANVDGKPGTDKRTPEAGKPTGAGPVPDTENRTSASLRGPAEGDPGLAAKLPVGDEGRTSERAERTPERDSKRVKVAGRPGSAEADGKKRRKLGFLEDTQDGEFVAIPFSPVRALLAALDPSVGAQLFC